jgi:hypothetical protein
VRYETNADLINYYREIARVAVANSTSLWGEIHKREWDIECEHDYSPCQWETSNGVKRAALWCSICGKKESNGIKKVDYPNFNSLPVYDQTLQDETREYINRLGAWTQEKLKLAFEKRREKESQEWFIRHNLYLKTPEWKERRIAVLRRDGYICQACLKNPAAHVHHLNYDHWGHEPLFDLASICVQCHDKITHIDRETRNGIQCAPDVSYYWQHEVTP